jgi:hypothetical protein
MQIQHSPGGSIFPYYYKNGELFCLHFGSYFADEDGVIAMIKAEQAFILKQRQQMGIWVDFYETKLTDRVLGEFIELLKQIRPQTTKLGLVGCAFTAKWKINRLVKRAEILSSLPIKYFEDPEIAKTWLVSELE